VSEDRSPESQRWLLLRNDANCKIKYALSNAPQETTMRQLVCVFQRKRTPVPIQSGHPFQLISDSCRSEATLWC
jgi:hypothetical protein